MTPTARLAPALLLAALLPLLVMPGCSEARHITATLASSSKPYQEFLEDPVNLTTIKTIAVFPFEDRAPQPGFDAEEFANRLANQLAAYGKVRVIYPKEILDRVDRENHEARRWNNRLREKIALGLYVPDADGEAGNVFAMEERDDHRPRPYYDPIRNTDEAVRLARRAKADAVIVGEVSDYDPYMRPRLSITMRLIATGNTETAAQAIAEMTQWGIPRTVSTGGGGVVYIRQQSFDSTIGSVGLEVSKYGRSHLIDHNPYDTEVFIRSMNHYYDVVASQLAEAYADARKKAVKEAEERAKAQAKRQNADANAARARLIALMERDARIPDYESPMHPEGWFDQAFLDKNAVLAGSGGDKRIGSWRGDGNAGRIPTSAERFGRDGMIPDNERGRGLEGYTSIMDSAFPDADEVMEMNMGARDRGWRPDYYNHANPAKSAPLYDPSEFVGK